MTSARSDREVSPPAWPSCLPRQDHRTTPSAPLPVEIHRSGMREAIVTMFQCRRPALDQWTGSQTKGRSPLIVGQGARRDRSVGLGDGPVNAQVGRICPVAGPRSPPPAPAGIRPQRTWTGGIARRGAPRRGCVARADGTDAPGSVAFAVLIGRSQHALPLVTCERACSLAGRADINRHHRQRGDPSCPRGFFIPAEGSAAALAAGSPRSDQ